MKTHYENGGEDHPLISLVHGRGLGDAYWEPLQQALQERGFGSLAHYLPVRDGRFDFKDLGKFISDTEQGTGAERIVRVPHSWGSNPALRAITEQVVGIDFISGTFHTSSIQPNRRQYLPKEQNSRTVIRLANPAIFSDQEERRFALFNGVPADRVEKYDMFREHPDVHLEPGLGYEADLLMRYIATTQDRLVPYDAQLDYAKAIKASVVVDIETGHMPMLAKPGELADIIIAPWLTIT